MAILEERPTLLRPPGPDESKAPIENVLDVTELKVLGPVCNRLGWPCYVMGGGG